MNTVVMLKIIIETIHATMERILNMSQRHITVKNNDVIDQDCTPDIKRQAIESINAIKTIIAQSLEIINGWKLTIEPTEPDIGVVYNFQISEFMNKVSWINILNNSFTNSISSHAFKSKGSVQQMIIQINTKADIITLVKHQDKKYAVLNTDIKNIKEKAYTSNQIAYMASSRTILKEIEDILTKLAIIFN